MKKLPCRLFTTLPTDIITKKRYFKTNMQSKQNKFENKEITQTQYDQYLLKNIEIKKNNTREYNNTINKFLKFLSNKYPVNSSAHNNEHILNEILATLYDIKNQESTKLIHKIIDMTYKHENY